MNGKNRMICALLIILLGLMAATGFNGTAVFAADSYSFTDLEKHWARSRVTRLSSLDLVKGYPDRTYRPEQLVSRLETIALVIRTGGFDAEASKQRTAAAGSSARSDTDANNDAIQIPSVPWGQSYLDLAITKGFLQLDQSGEFVYNNPASRLEVARLLARALYLVPPLPVSGKAEGGGTGIELDVLEPDCIFNDEKSLSESDRAIVRAVAAAGVMSGYPDGAFLPQKHLTRAEMAVILSRLVDRGWVKTAEGRRVSGWISHVETQKGYQELELTSLAGKQKIRLAAGALCFRGEEEWPLERALNYRCEVILNGRRQAAWVDLLEQRIIPQKTDKIRGSVRSVALGEDNLLVLNDLHCQDQVLPLAWDAAVEGKNADKGFQSLKAGSFVDLEVAGGQVRKAIILEVKIVSGTVEGFDNRRLYLKEGTSKNRPGWFNYWDWGRIVDREGKSLSRVSVGDQVQVTYIDPFPEEIDDEIVVEIKLKK